MKILSISTADQNCTVAISEDRKLVKEININTGLTHSETLLPSIDKLFKETNLSLEDIDAYAICTGPGSFTGIRIGIATIKGIAFANKKPIIPVSSLLGLAYNVKDFTGNIVSCIDARNDNVYAGIFKKNKNSIELVGDYFSDEVSTLIDKVLDLEPITLVVGDGVSYFINRFSNEKPSAMILYANPEDYFLKASSIALAAFDLYEKGITTDDIHVTPLYLKKSQAERELEEKILKKEEPKQIDFNPKELEAKIIERFDSMEKNDNN